MLNTVLHRKNVILLLDKERPPSVAVTVEAISQLKFEILPQYSPRLAPSYYLMFGPLKETLRRRIFARDEEITDAVLTGLPPQPKNFLQIYFKNTSCVIYKTRHNRLHVSAYLVFWVVYYQSRKLSSHLESKGLWTAKQHAIKISDFCDKWNTEYPFSWDRSIVTSIGDFSTECDLVFPISNYAILYFAEIYPVAAYVFFLVFIPYMYEIGPNSVIIVFSVRITDTHSWVPEMFPFLCLKDLCAWVAYYVLVLECWNVIRLF